MDVVAVAKSPVVVDVAFDYLALVAEHALLLERFRIHKNLILGDLAFLEDALGVENGSAVGGVGCKNIKI